MCVKISYIWIAWGKLSPHSMEGTSVWYSMVVSPSIPSNPSISLWLDHCYPSFLFNGWRWSYYKIILPLTIKKKKNIQVNLQLYHCMSRCLGQETLNCFKLLKTVVQYAIFRQIKFWLKRQTSWKILILIGTNSLDYIYLYIQLMIN